MKTYAPILDIEGQSHYSIVDSINHWRETLPTDDMIKLVFMLPEVNDSEQWRLEEVRKALKDQFPKHAEYNDVRLFTQEVKDSDADVLLVGRGMNHSQMLFDTIKDALPDIKSKTKRTDLVISTSSLMYMHKLYCMGWSADIDRWHHWMVNLWFEAEVHELVNSQEMLESHERVREYLKSAALSAIKTIVDLGLEENELGKYKYQCLTEIEAEIGRNYNVRWPHTSRFGIGYLTKLQEEAAIRRSEVGEMIFQQ